MNPHEADGIDWQVDFGPGEWRAQATRGATIIGQHILRPHWSSLLPGDIVAARLVDRRGVLDIAGETVVLQGPVPRAAEGQMLAVEIMRTRLPEPGRWKPARARATSTPVPAPEPLAHRWLNRLGATRTSLVRLEFDLVTTVDFGAGAWSMERTRAGCVVDIDGTVDQRDAVVAQGGRQGANMAALPTLLAALKRYAVGGSILIDFIAAPDRTARQTLAAAFDVAATSILGPCERTAINGYGLMQIVRPRTGPSWLDLWSGTGTAGESSETRAIALLRQALWTPGAGPRQIVVSPALAPAFAAFDDVLADLGRRLGAPVNVTIDPGLAGPAGPEGHVHVVHP